MVRNKNRIVPPVNTGITLSCDDRRKFTEFVMVLVKINECIKVRDCINEDSKKTVKKVKQRGSLDPADAQTIATNYRRPGMVWRTGCGPFQLSSGHACFLNNNSFSLETMEHIAFIVSRNYALQQAIGNN
jgi:hypothetical protein